MNDASDLCPVWAIPVGFWETVCISIRALDIFVRFGGGVVDATGHRVLLLATDSFPRLHQGPAQSQSCQDILRSFIVESLKQHHHGHHGGDGHQLHDSYQVHLG